MYTRGEAFSTNKVLFTNCSGPLPIIIGMPVEEGIRYAITKGLITYTMVRIEFPITGFKRNKDDKSLHGLCSFELKLRQTISHDLKSNLLLVRSIKT